MSLNAVSARRVPSWLFRYSSQDRLPLAVCGDAAQREVLLLVGLESMRYEQVATILDIPVGTVRSRLSRARATLRLLMDGDNGANDRLSDRYHGLAA